MKAFKSLLDVGLYEGMSRARRGAIKWAQNRPRALASNTHDADVEEGESFLERIKFQTFWEMVRPCLCEEASEADVDAILKRATLLVTAKCFACYRKAFGHGPVLRPWPGTQRHGKEHVQSDATW